MGISYGGQSLIEPNAVLEACLRMGLPTRWYGLPNNMTVPLGVLPGEGWVLLARDSLDNLSMATLYDLAFAATDAVSGAASTVTWKNLLMVGAECLTAGARTDPAAPYLVKLADRRWLCRKVPIDKAYNVRNCTSGSGYFSATLNSGTPWTWAQMAQDVWNQVGKLGTFPGLPFTPDGTPEGFDFYGWPSAMKALGVILDRLSCALRLDPTKDTFGVVRLGARDTYAAAALQSRDALRAWDEDPLTPVRALVPAKVRVVFPTWKPTQDGTGASPYYTVDVTDTSPLPGTEPNTFEVVYDDLAAVYNSLGTLTNSGALASRAAERAKDYFRVVKLARLHRSYGMPLPDQGLLPGAQLKAVRVGDKGKGMVTEVLQARDAAGGAVMLGPAGSEYQRNDCEPDPFGMWSWEERRDNERVQDRLRQLCCGSGGGTAQVLVQITSRTYPSGGSQFAAYSCVHVTDSLSTPVTYTAGSAGPTFYNLNDVDLPVGLVCWIYQSANGTWYLNDNDTRVDVVQKTGVVPDGNGLYDGTLYRYNDGTHAIEARGSIKVLDITGP